jgi:hypothetical protein
MLPRTIPALCGLFALLLAGCDSSSGPANVGESRALVILDTAQASDYDPLGTQVHTVYQGRRYTAKVLPSGPGLTYRWGFRGLWTESDTAPRFALPILRKSDSGTTVLCIVTSASWQDTLEHRLRVMLPAWEPFSLTSGAQGSGSYGPFLNFDTAVDANMDQRRDMALGNEINLDLVTAFIATGAGSGVYKLLTPRLAARMGLASTLGMDSARLTATPMVLISRASLDTLTQEGVRALYDRSVKRDSVTFSDEGSFGGSAFNAVLVKTTTGRLVQLTGTVFIGGDSTEAYYSVSGKRGAIPD